MHLQPIRRRRLLKLGALSAVALGTAGTFMFARRHGSGHDTSGYGPFLVLDDDHVRTLRALTDVVLPTAVAGDDALHRKVIARIDEEFYFVDGKIRDDFRLALDALEYLPVMYGRFSRFSWLETDARRAFLDDMKTTRIDLLRAAIHNCRMVPLYIYYGLQDSWDGIGYDGSFSKVTPLVSEQRQHYADQVGGRRA